MFRLISAFVAENLIQPLEAAERKWPERIKLEHNLQY
jgi:hypothetical protein